MELPIKYKACNSRILVLLNKDKISELHNSETLISFKISNSEKLAMTSQLDLIHFYGVIIRNSNF